MQKLLSLSILIALCAILPARADECCQNSEATVQQRLHEIDLNIALRQYEQIRNEAAKAELQLVLIETETEAPEADRVKQTKLLRKRLDILAAHADQIRARVLELGKATAVAAN